MASFLSTAASHFRDVLVVVVSAAFAVFMAILVNTHVIKSDGPGPVGHALAIYLIIFIHKRRCNRKSDA